MKFEVFVLQRVFVDVGDAASSMSNTVLDFVESTVRQSDERLAVIDSKIVHARRLNDNAKSEDLV
jgi:hypothetical protein